MADIPEARDEHNMHAGEVASLLMRGEPRQKLIDHLWLIETENMGLPGDRPRTERQRTDSCSFVMRSTVTPSITFDRTAGSQNASNDPSAEGSLSTNHGAAASDELFQQTSDAKRDSG